MDKTEIVKYYLSLSNGEKGRFTAFLSIHLGGAPHTWQQKIQGWARSIAGKPLSPLVHKEICNIIPKRHMARLVIYKIDELRTS